MSRRGLVGRGDLARVLAGAGAAERADGLAHVLGFERAEVPASAPAAPAGAAVAPESPQVEARPLDDVPFLYATAFRTIAGETADHDGSLPAASQPAGASWEPPSGPPPEAPLVSWRALEPRLRALLAPPGPGRAIDLPRAVDQLARQALVERWPARRQARWARRLDVVLDRSRHLVPFWQDQEAVLWRLRRWLPFSDIRVLVFDEIDLVFRDPAADGAPAVAPGDGGDPVLVLGDLGRLAPQAEAAGFWSRLGRRLGPGRALALSPVAPGLLPADLRAVWRAAAWDEAVRAVPWPAQRRLAERLLRLVSPAVRIEPGLLRVLRRRLLPDAPASVEALLWRGPALAGKSSVAGVLDRETAIRLRREFDLEPEDDRERALALIRQWRSGLPREIWFEEVMELSPASRGLVPPADLQAARGHFAALAARMRAAGSDALGAGHRAWLSRVGGRTETAWQDAAFREAVWPIMCRNEGFLPPVGPGVLPPGDAPVGPVALALAGDGLTLRTGIEGEGSLLALLPSDDGLVEVLPAGRPAWASDAGEDGYGRWAEFTHRGVTQRLRWIPPGRFLMGSPDDEDGRWPDEGPQTEITFRDGFWMFDTAVTQALYRVVTGESPSTFEGDDQRPVESVSWNDAQSFVERLNAALPGRDLRLPSEAEWEYACRAGTIAPHVFGETAEQKDIHFKGDATVGVRERRPNPWGLYQMLGNVREWCADVWSGSHAGADPGGRPRPVDAAGEHERVVRGGSWGDGARYVRAAFRHWVEPGDRRDDLGFRCAGGRVPEVGGRDARRAGAADPPGRVAEPRPGGTVRAQVRPGRPRDRVALPPAAFVVRTDRAELDVRRLTRTELPWADAVGRDRFGLWSEFTLSDVVTRLRWIPPGRFLMGSPEDEPGRFDDEGPQVEVTLLSGFWLMDAPVTQALWQAVIGNNPSRFVSPDRPVERVDWEDVHEFMERVNDRLPGLDLRLPSEAEWEYACRAGTATATYAGPMEILEEHNAPALDAIAWYGGNSGVGFDLEGGEDSSGWAEKKYGLTRSGTRPLRLKRANPWGLYDMLGNVWEWCADGWSLNHEGADPHGAPRLAEDGEQGRIVRGGGWNARAWVVRAAYRDRLGPDARIDDLGFRCAGGQVPGAGLDARREGAEPSRRRKR